MTKRYKVIKAGLTDASQAPRGTEILYHCGICDDYIPSAPKDNIRCKCRNIVIDNDYIRMFVKDFSKFTVVEKQK